MHSVCVFQRYYAIVRQCPSSPNVLATFARLPEEGPAGVAGHAPIVHTALGDDLNITTSGGRRLLQKHSFIIRSSDILCSDNVVDRLQ